TLDVALVNAGMLTATNGTLTVTAAPVHTGGIIVANTGIFSVTPDWTSSGTILINDTGALTGGTLTNASNTGTLSGSGFIKSLLVNQGRMNFGGTVSNNFLQTAGSFTLSGNATITGTATLTGGTLNLLGNRLTNGLLVVSGAGVLTNDIS